MKYILLLFGLILLLIIYINNKYKIYEGQIPIIDYMDPNITRGAKAWRERIISEYRDDLEAYSEGGVRICTHDDQNDRDCIRLCSMVEDAMGLGSQNTCLDGQYCSSDIRQEVTRPATLTNYITNRYPDKDPRRARTYFEQMYHDGFGICKNYDTYYIKECPGDQQYKSVINSKGQLEEKMQLDASTTGVINPFRAGQGRTVTYDEEESQAPTGQAIVHHLEAPLWAKENEMLKCINNETENILYRDVCRMTHSITGVFDSRIRDGIPRKLCKIKRRNPNDDLNNAHYCFSDVEIAEASGTIFPAPMYNQPNGREMYCQ